MQRSRSILSVLLVIVFATGIVFYKFNKVPAGLTQDEIEFARLALLLDNQPYVPYHEYATGHATLYFYVLLGFLKNLTLSAHVLRLPSAIFGVLSIVFSYLVFRSLKWKKSPIQSWMPLFMALLYGGMRWYFNFARFSFEATFVLLLEMISLLGILWFIKIVEKRSTKYLYTIPLLLSGVFAGLAYNSYQPGRLFFLIPLLALLLTKKAYHVKNFFIYLLSFAIVITPLTLFLAQNQDIRIKQQLYLQDETRTPIEKVGFFADNVIRTTHMFFYSGDASGIHNYPFKPALNPIVLLLFVYGLLLAVKDYKDRQNAIFLAWFGIGIAPTLLTYPHENPNMLRTVTALPSIVYFAGIGLQEFAVKVSHIKKFAIKKYVPLLAALVIATSVVYEARTYFLFQSKVFEESFEVKDGMSGLYAFMLEENINIYDYTLTGKDKKDLERVYFFYLNRWGRPSR